MPDETAAARDVLAEEARDLAASERVSRAQAVYDEIMEDYDPTEPDHEEYAFDAMKAAIAQADADRDALSLPAAPPAPVAPGEGDQWQPISTAPKDGTWFLGFYSHLRGDRFDEHRLKVCRWRYRQGWVDADEKMFVDPTHWRPLPPPPAPSSGEG